MANPIATVGGIALAPGVSRNGRLYTKQAIAGMVARAQDRIASGESIVLRDEPPESHVITQLTHHAAADDSTRIVGRVTGLSLDQAGNARFIADIAPTESGRTIAALLDTSDGKAPFLRGVSGRMAWIGGARVARGPAGEPVETGDDLELLGLDYTHKPGVPAAAVDTFSWTDGGTKSETSDRVLITESVQEALVAPITEATTPAEASGDKSCADLGHVCCKAGASESVGAAFRAVVAEPGHVLADGICVTCAPVTEAATPMSKRGSGTQGTGGPYADPGYQTDKKQRYQLDSKAHAKAAWSFINQAKNAKAYSAAQLKRIKGRIMKALKTFGVSTATEGWAIDDAVLVTEALTECYGGIGDCDPEQAGSYSISASNGPTNISICSYRLDPAELEVILRAAVEGACQALAALDPDMDGDIDVAGAPNADSDNDAGETTPPEDDPAAEAGETDPADLAESQEPPAPDSAAGTTEHEEVPAMAETSTQAAESTTAAPALTQDDINKAVAAALAASRAARRARKAARTAKPAETAPAGQVTETAPAAGTTEVAESEDEKIARIVKARLDEEAGPAESEDERIERKINESLEAARAEMVRTGQLPAGRKGIVKGANESVQAGGDVEMTVSGIPKAWGKELHQMTQEEFDRTGGPVLARHILGARADLLA